MATVNDCDTYEVIFYLPGQIGGSRWAIGALVHTDEGTRFIESRALPTCLPPRKQLVLKAGLDELREAEAHPHKMAVGPHFTTKRRMVVPRGVGDSMEWIRENVLPGGQDE